MAPPGGAIILSLSTVDDGLVLLQGGGLSNSPQGRKALGELDAGDWEAIRG